VKTEQAYAEIMASEVFRRDGPAIDLPEALLALAAAILADPEEPDWNLGECSEAPLDSLVIGAFWALVDWHGGQASPEYAALCQLGRIFQPGPFANGPEPETSEADAHAAICSWFSAQYD